MATTHPAGAAIEAEADDYENDSAYDATSILSSTTSLNSEVMRYRKENGRTYHGYKDGAYAFPNDEVEQDRLDLQHHLFMLTYDGKLHIAPIPKSQTIHRALDIGTGTGIWAIDFADSHPETAVTGVDLSPIQPQFVPPNLSFMVDDVEEHWEYANKFDFIYSRMMIGSLNDVPKFFRQAFDNLNPGGWVEMADIVYPCKLNDGQWPEDSALKKWSELFQEAVRKTGKNPNVGKEYKNQMIEAGYENVVEKVHLWPGNRWPKDKKLKELGMWTLENTNIGLEAMSVALFTRALGWSKPEVDIFLIKVMNEMRDTKLHAYWEIYTVYGQKPNPK